MDKELKQVIMKRISNALDFDNAAALILERHGKDDWAVYFPDNDYSVRGTAQQIIEEIKDITNE